MNKPAIQINPGQSITAIVNGVPLVIDNTHPNFNKTLEAIRNQSWDDLEILMAPVTILKTAVSKTGGRCELVGSEVFYNNKPLHNYATTKLLQILELGLDVQYLLNFLDKLMSNPSYRVVESLYAFLEGENLPITEDGDFLAYKVVRKEGYESIHQGNNGPVYNVPGTEVTEERNTVDDNPDIGCSNGLHAGNLSYVKSFGGAGIENGDYVIVTVKIDPKDVVSVPNEDCKKLRCCRYFVVNEFTKEMTDAVYKADGITISNRGQTNHIDDCDDDYDDDYYADDYDVNDDDD